MTTIVTETTTKDTVMETTDTNMNATTAEAGSTSTKQAKSEETESSTIDSSFYDLVNVSVVNNEYWRDGYEPLIENSTRVPRPLTPYEEYGSNIMFAIKTGMSMHKRFPVLFDTWFTVVNTSTLFIVTDGEDKALENRAKEIGARYINTRCEDGYLGCVCSV